MRHPRPLAILGSARANGNTAAVLRRLLDGLDCDVVDLSTCRIAPYDYDHNYPVGDQFLALIERAIAAPITVVATPVYWYSYSTPTKVFIDRFSDLLGWRSDLGR